VRKIKSLFKRNYETDRLIKDEVVEGSKWVLNGEGIATRKYDGTCCMIKDGQLYRRFDVKKGRKVPENFIPAQDKDVVTGHWPGWVKCEKENPQDKWHIEAFDSKLEDGTYELCGPKVQCNPENFNIHVLVKHGVEVLENVPRDFNGIKSYLIGKDIEGIVWYRKNGDMVKVKLKDFGIKRK
jgi:hypothetical protein